LAVVAHSIHGCIPAFPETEHWQKNSSDPVKDGGFARNQGAPDHLSDHLVIKKLSGGSKGARNETHPVGFVAVTGDKSTVGLEAGSLECPHFVRQPSHPSEIWTAANRQGVGLFGFLENTALVGGFF
jgi:hypothetical protein